MCVKAGVVCVKAGVVCVKAGVVCVKAGVLCVTAAIHVPLHFQACTQIVPFFLPQISWGDSFTVLFCW